MNPPIDKPSLGAVIEGVVRGSTLGVPIAGVVVTLDREPRDTTAEDGTYRVEGVTPGDHTLRFFHPAFLAVLDGVTFDVAIAFDAVQYQLDVPWPSIDKLVSERCSKAAGWRYGPVALLGRVQAIGNAAPPRDLRAEISWSRPAAPLPKPDGALPIGGFSAVTVAVQPNSGFLACHLPVAARARVTITSAVASGRSATATVTLPMHGFVALTVSLRP